MLQPHRPPQAQTKRSRGAIILAAVVCVCLWAISHSRNGSRSSAGASSLAADDPNWPKVKTIKGLEALWEVPPGAPRGVLFVAHGCSHQGSDFWLPSPRCRHCLGLPEEVRVRRMALARGYAVVAVTSFDRESKCWQNRAPSKSEDLQRLPSILREVVKAEGLQGLPLYAFGASSGGGIVLRLAQIMPEIKGVICQINPVNPGVLEAEGRPYPPTAFVHMALRDPQKAELNAAAVALLKRAGVPAAEIKIEPRPLTPELLQRSPLISAEVAGAIVDALRSNGYLDEAGFFLKDPRSGAHLWRQLLQPLVGDVSLEADASPVAELFNVAFARHEIVSDTTDACLTWLEAGGKTDMSGLLPQR